MIVITGMRLQSYIQQCTAADAKSLAYVGQAESTLLGRYTLYHACPSLRTPACCTGGSGTDGSASSTRGRSEWLLSQEIAEVQRLLHTQRTAGRFVPAPYPSDQAGACTQIGRCSPAWTPSSADFPFGAERLHQVLSSTNSTAFVLALSDGTHWRCLAVSPRTRIIWMFDPLGNNVTRQLSHTIHSLLTRMQVSHTWRAQHVQLKTQYDSYNCGVWAIWLSQELQTYEAQSSDVSLQNWLMARLRLVPGDAGAKGNSLRHLYSQMRLLAQLRPLHEPFPPAIDDMPALADYAQALSTGSSPHTRPHEQTTTY